jgi:hypothetical protein
MSALSLTLFQCAAARPAPAASSLTVQVQLAVTPARAVTPRPVPRTASADTPPSARPLVIRSPRPPRAVTGIFAGHDHACAMTDEGGVYCWGRNDRGQTGQVDRPPVTCGRARPNCEPYEGDHGTTRAPARVDALGPVRTLSLGESVSAAVTTDGALRVWGLHGDSHEQRRAVRPVMGLGDPRDVHLGLRGGCAVADTGDVRCFEAGSLEPETVRDTRGMLRVYVGTYQRCGWDGEESLRCRDVGLRLTSEGPEHARYVLPRAAGWSVRASGREVCGWTRDGRVACAGHPGGYTRGTIRPGEIPTLREVVQVVSGEAHVCARTGGGAVWCWGSNANGQVGDGTTIDRNVPVRVERLPECMGLAAGGDFTCALVRDGSVQCWGDNAWGQLGGTDPRESHRTDPQPVLW